MDFTSVESSNMNGVTYFNKYLLILTNKTKFYYQRKTTKQGKAIYPCVMVFKLALLSHKFVSHWVSISAKHGGGTP